MNRSEGLAEIVSYWLDKAKESLLSAQDELSAGRLPFAVNRIYYACFYAVSAALLTENLKFKKHSGVRASFHQYLVKTGKVSQDKSGGTIKGLPTLGKAGKKPSRGIRPEPI